MENIYPNGIETNYARLLSFLIENHPEKRKLLAGQTTEMFVEKRVRRIANEWLDRNLIEDLRDLLAGIDLTQIKIAPLSPI